jgi:peptidoglycan/LPS O-acetylase OafA/YrhL
MLYHFILYTQVTRLAGVWSRPSLGFFDSLGPGSVNLFFMTTGFLFYPRVLKGLGSVSWTGVYISRVFRIIPLVVFSVSASALLTLIRLNFHPDAPMGESIMAMLRWIVCWDQPDLFGYRGSGQLGSVLWSLWFEWLFYLFVLPACAAIMSIRGRAPTWAIPAGLIVVSLAVKPFHLLPIIDFLPLFGIGMLAFEARERRAIAEALSGRFATVLAFACLFAGAALFTGPARTVLHGLFFVCIACDCSLWGLLRLRGPRVLGELSYGIYVLHMLVLNILFVTFERSISHIPTLWLWTLMPFVAVAVILIATVTFLFLERPAIKLGKQLAASLIERPRHENPGSPPRDSTAEPASSASGNSI